MSKRNNRHRQIKTSSSREAQLYLNLYRYGVAFWYCTD